MNESIHIAAQESEVKNSLANGLELRSLSLINPAYMTEPSPRSATDLIGEGVVKVVYRPGENNPDLKGRVLIKAKKGKSSLLKEELDKLPKIRTSIFRRISGRAAQAALERWHKLDGNTNVDPSMVLTKIRAILHLAAGAYDRFQRSSDEAPSIAKFISQLDRSLFISWCATEALEVDFFDFWWEELNNRQAAMNEERLGLDIRKIPKSGNDAFTAPRASGTALNIVDGFQRGLCFLVRLAFSMLDSVSLLATSDAECWGSKWWIHGDLKLENFLVYNLESGPILVVSDFGKAKSVKPYSRKFHFYTGNLHYIDGKCRDGVKSDAYAVGLMLSQLLDSYDMRTRENVPESCPEVRGLVAKLLLTPGTRQYNNHALLNVGWMRKLTYRSALLKRAFTNSSMRRRSAVTHDITHKYLNSAKKTILRIFKQRVEAIDSLFKEESHCECDADTHNTLSTQWQTYLVDYKATISTAVSALFAIQRKLLITEESSRKTVDAVLNSDPDGSSLRVCMQKLNAMQHSLDEATTTIICMHLRRAVCEFRSM